MDIASLLILQNSKAKFNTKNSGAVASFFLLLSFFFPHCYKFMTFVNLKYIGFSVSPFFQPHFLIWHRKREIDRDRGWFVLEDEANLEWEY